MKREKFGSRLGFLLISAGCAIGLGNVYRFPITTGSYGGAIFVFIYMAFLVLLGLPIMTAELTVGRGSQASIATSFDILEKKGQKWHWMKWLGIAGNYLLMMFYTVISSWMVIYFFKYLFGKMEGLTTTEELGGVFADMISRPGLLFFTTFGIIILGFGICSLGLQKGVERITKGMMVCLFALLAGLAIYSCTLSGAKEGLSFYLIPNAKNIESVGLLTVIRSAMGQAFFTLSIGIGSIAIFGSYIGKDRRLLGESVTIVSLDTVVALMAGLIIFPACFTYAGGVNVDAGKVGASFLFINLSAVFGNMAIGRVIGTLFFLFMIFAAFSTVIAVFENIVSMWIDIAAQKGKTLKRPKVTLINIALMSVLILPALFSLNIWSNFMIGEKGFMDLEDYVVSNILLPIGSLVYVGFCTWKFGWGWNNFYAETSTGEKGLCLPKWMRVYMTFVLPIIILFVMASSLF